jgi:hypothetical protein
MTACTLDEVVAQNQDAPGIDPANGAHLKPYGMPDGYNFKDCGLHYPENAPVPAGFQSGTGYVHTAPREDKPNPRQFSIESKDDTCWYRRKDNKQWITPPAQKPGQHISGFFQKADFSANSGVAFPIKQGNPTVVPSPVYDVIGHWWPTERGLWPVEIDAFFTYCSMRVTDPSISGIIIAQRGLDWWATPSGGSNTAAGVSDWRMVTSDWTDFVYVHYQGFDKTKLKAWLEANPPPYQYAGGAPPVEQAISSTVKILDSTGKVVSTAIVSGDWSSQVTTDAS